MSKDAFFISGLGHMAFQLAWAGFESGLFSLLYHNGWTEKNKIKDELELPENSLTIILMGLVSLSLLQREERDGGIFYGLSTDMKDIFDSFPIEKWYAIARLHYFVIYDALCCGFESFKAGKNLGLSRIPGEGVTLYEKFQNNETLRNLFYGFMQAISDMANKELAASGVWDEVNVLLDVGGGNGANAIAIAKHHPHIKVIIYDLPATCEKAKEVIEKEGLADRVSVFSGDFFKDEFPSGVDGILFAHIMTIWSQEKNLFLLKKAFDSLTPGGRAFVFNMVSKDDETGPLMCTLSNVYFLAIASGEGMIYKKGEYLKWFEESGFSALESLDFPFYHALLSGKK